MAFNCYLKDVVKWSDRPFEIAHEIRYVFRIALTFVIDVTEPMITVFTHVAFTAGNSTVTIGRAIMHWINSKLEFSLTNWIIKAS